MHTYRIHFGSKCFGHDIVFFVAGVYPFEAMKTLKNYIRDNWKESNNKTRLLDADHVVEPVLYAETNWHVFKTKSIPSTAKQVYPGVYAASSGDFLGDCDY